MNVRRLIARLNAKSQRIDNRGSGGIPEYTPADIAGALGTMKDKFAREVLCAIWWPEGASLVEGWLMQEISHLQFEEIDRQLAEVYASRLELHIAIDGHADQKDINKLRLRVEQAQKGVWDIRGYGEVVRRAVLLEATKPKTCRTCDGVGYFITKQGIKVCAKCDGSGFRPMLVGERAKMLGISTKTYLRHGIRAVYEWTYALVQDAEQRGANELYRALK